MTLLDRACDLYVAALLERKNTDPLIMRLRSFITQSFQQEGMRVVDEIDRINKKGTLELPLRDANQIKIAAIENVQQQQSKKEKPEYRKFDHPSQGMTGKPHPSFRAGIGKVRGILREQVEENPDSNEGLLDTSQVKKNIVAVSGQTEKGAAVDAAVKMSGETQKTIGKANEQEIATMQPSVVAKHYTREVIEAYLKQNSIEYAEKGSHRQLAATLVNYLKRKSD